MPESLLKSNVFRSLGYMRPLCIWSIQYAIDSMNKIELEIPSEQKIFILYRNLQAIYLWPCEGNTKILNYSHTKLL